VAIRNDTRPDCVICHVLYVTIFKSATHISQYQQQRNYSIGIRGDLERSPKLRVYDFFAYLQTALILGLICVTYQADQTRPANAVSGLKIWVKPIVRQRHLPDPRLADRSSLVDLRRPCGPAALPRNTRPAIDGTSGSSCQRFKVDSNEFKWLVRQIFDLMSVGFHPLDSSIDVNLTCRAGG
jgi:hypothetical protein